MNIGSNNGTAHVIEEVIFDFSFDANTVAHEHESLMSAWIVDEMLPVIEAALNEYDEKGKVLRIERITIDLGDIHDTDYTKQIIQRVYEQLVLQLKAARSSGELISQTSRHLTQPAILQHINSSADGLIVQQVSRLQSDLEILEHFLVTGNLPWHIDAIDSRTHEKLLERVLLDAKGSDVLRTLMVKIPSTRRAVFVRRLVNQYSNKNLEKILIQIAPKRHELLLELVRAYQTVLSARLLQDMQQASAIQLLWEQIFKAIIDNAHALDSLNLSKVIPRMLQKLAAAALLDQNVLIKKLIHASRNQLKDSRLPVILADQTRKPEPQRRIQPHSKETKTGVDSQYGKMVLLSEKSFHLSYAALLYQHIKAALQQTGIDEADLFLENLQSSNLRSIQKQLFEILQDKRIRTLLISRLPQFILIDIAYVLSPQAALVLEQVLAHGEMFSRRAKNHHHADPKAWEKQLLESALNFLVTQPAEVLTTNSFDAFNFLHEILNGLSDDEENRSVLQSWHDDLQQQSHKKEIGANVLQNIILDAISIAESVPYDILTSQEIKLITAALKTDFPTQQQQLKAAIESGRLIPEKLSEDVSKPMIQALLKYGPGLTDADRQMFIEAIETHAWKTGNRTFYYQQVLAKLMSDETVDLEDIALQAERHNLFPTDTVIPTKTATAGENQLIQEKEIGAASYRRILLALQQVADNSPDMQFKHLQTANTASIKKQLLKLLQDKTWRTRLITQLPQSVLLDISYVLSPQAAIILEQLMLHDETLYRQTVNKSQATVTEWKYQLWGNALSFFVRSIQEHSFDAADFLHGLVYGLSGDNDTAAILRNWHEVLKQEHGQEKTVLQSILLDAVSSSKAAPHDILASDEVRQILAALETDFKHEQQRLKTAFYTGLFFPGKLSEIELKHVVLALLKHDPALNEADSETFIHAIEAHAYKAENSTSYYQHILEKLLREQVVDLEAIVSQSMDLHDQAHAETDVERSVIQSKAAIVIIWQRIRSALKQSGINGADLFLEQLNTANAQTIQKRLLDLLQNTGIRTQLIASLPRSILIDIIYLLSPQAALVIEQLLSNAEMLFQYTPKKNAANVAEWEQQLWEGSFGYFLDMPAINASVDRLEPIALVHTLIDKLSDSKDGFTTIQSWHNALAQMQGIEYGQDHGTRVLRHVVETLMLQLKSGSQRRTEQLFHPQISVTRTDRHAEPMMPNQMAERDDEDKAGDEFYIHNAGQVLAAPYLPRLFSLLGLIDKGVFVDRAAAERAVHLLQFMVNEETQSPEYQLLLNKILCGLSTAIPICSQIEISQREQETVEDLIQGMIQNWKIIGNTSIQGLRETFLQRNGRLLLKDEMWFLTIEPRPFDMLLDQLPWSFSVIKHRWMERAIHVTWR